MTYATITTAAHTAHLDPLTGEGVLVLPDPSQDVRDPFVAVESVHARDWTAMLRQLDGLGWELSEDEEDGGMIDVGETHDGRTIVGRCGRDPVMADPTLDVLAKSAVELRALAARSVTES